MDIAGLNEHFLNTLEFFVLCIVEELKNRDTVANLQPKRMGQIINHDDVFELPVLNNTKILYEESVLSLHTIFPMQKSKDGFLLLVEVSNDWLSIVVGSSCKDIDVVVVGHIGQELKAIGPHVELEFIAFACKFHISLIIRKN